jgi:hypothetical protein
MMSATHHRHDAVTYAFAFAGLVVAGLVWNGILSMILAPLWMLLTVWLVPAGLARVARYLR